MSETAGRKKIALVTGATDGVGRYVASRLAAAGYHVLVHGRDQGRGESLMREISEAGGTAQFYPADLSSLQQVRDLAQAVLLTQDWLDLLINNAGIGTTNAEGSDGREESVDGFELRFAVNYLAGFLLTQLLLPRLLASQPARIVNVASAGQHAIDFDDLMLTRAYSGARAYCQSKLAQILFTIDLAQQLEGSGVTVNALHPATYMNTTMVRRSGMRPISSIEEGGDAILHLALAAELDGQSGLYFNGKRPAKAEAQAYDPSARAKLRKLSFRLVGIEDPAAAA
ncbi:SDR family NAD(P)-dependent oxidoreductase [uncultured Ferrovibrio sp.]|jgi:NAD(P)-dependent dehydrogenase (short-subunit alcohol dehydrogenase family)|uniref:SDR family NAD(P)-dependent oxidoreductase n=1 Tax=uncultured Ferrovibrio sp. TaxID=1576913 RepID=UPI00262AB1ED|nr:SDR family NAD(P)-dependent oxidoreductase [uncultured Ferrovibrio sp.]